MYTTAHLAAGLIIGKLTGDYPTAIISSVAIDLDHLVPYAREGALGSVKKFLARTKSVHGSGRSYLHSFIAWGVITGILCIFSLKIGLVFGLGYLGHFLLDAVDNSDFYPLFPLKKWNTKGFIGYYSRAELIFTIVLFAIFFLI
ncbi:MAG TPA: metal-dependent hydrolase [bacterium]|nr:metal-dependent hydrolase [bacterium]HPT29946.1 metal-dependent hydrolase [bacterium]